MPDRIRVHALAKLLGVTSKQVLEKLQDLGSSARSASSSVVRTEAESVTTALAPPPVEETPAAVEETPEVPAPEPAEAESVAVEPAAVEPAVEPAADETAVVEPAAEPVAAEISADRAPVVDDATPFGSALVSAFSDEAANVHASTPPVAAAFEMPLFLAPAAAPEAEEAVEDTSRTRRRRGRRQAGAPAPEDTVADVTEDTAAAAAPVVGRVSDDETVAEDVADESTDDADSDTDLDASDEAGRDGEASGNRRRRRGRRGRGRGRGGDADLAADSEGSDAEGDGSTDTDAEAVDTETEQSAPEESSDADDSDADGDSSTSRRRRRRRRRGSGDPAEGVAETVDDPPNTVVHEREPRPRSKRDEVQGITGSTRLEAKRQRRRDGRDAGRRRPPILSEAEFLARREAVDRTMVVREKMHPDHRTLTQVAVLEDGVLVEHFVTSTASASIVGNVYLGRVQNVLPGMEAAFVDIGRGRNGVLYAGEVDWDSAGLGGNSRRIEQALKPGDQVLVQVSKDPVGHKGARLTTQISLAGRYLVYVPNGGSSGISRKLPDTERKRLKEVLRDVVPADAGVIIRTASEGVSAEELARDVGRLQTAWENIKNRADKKENGSGPVSLYEEPDLLVKVVRDLFNEDFSKLVIEGDRSWSTVQQYIEAVAPDMLPRVERYEPSTPDIDVFDVYRIDEQLAKALDRKVWLPSGGTLVIDRTEAMTVVDVNTGKFTGSGGNLEETVTRNNLEAAEEIVRQLRLRDVGGMIVVDFIDMVLESNRDLVLRRLTEALGRDRTRHQVSEVTSLGLVQMTRKRLGTGLVEAFSTPCEHCHGRGLIVHPFPVEAAGEEQRNNSRSEQAPSSRRKRGRKSAQASEPAEPVTEAAPRRPHPVALAMASRDVLAGDEDGAPADGVIGDGVIADGAVADDAAGEAVVIDAVAADVAVLDESGADVAVVEIVAETDDADVTDTVADPADAVVEAAETVEGATETAEAAVDVEVAIAEPAGLNGSEPESTGGSPQADTPALTAEPAAAERAGDAGESRTDVVDAETPEVNGESNGSVEPERRSTRTRRARRASRPAAASSASGAVVVLPDTATSAPAAVETHAPATIGPDAHATVRSDASAPPRQRRRRAAGRPAGPPVDAPAEPGAV
nr:translation initiation factor IF-2 N-terminal domain-containing protein [Millisia brevis]